MMIQITKGSLNNSLAVANIMQCFDTKQLVISQKSTNFASEAPKYTILLLTMSLSKIY